MVLLVYSGEIADIFTLERHHMFGHRKHAGDNHHLVLLDPRF